MAEKKEEKELNFKPYIGVAIFMFIVILGAYFANFGILGLSPLQEHWGTFGDFVGGTLNPTLAFLSFLALLRTIQIQSNELKASREELEMTRDELSRSADAQKEQSDSIKLQNFENTFFNLVNLHNNTLKSLKMPSETRIQFTYEVEPKVTSTYDRNIGKEDKVGSETISCLRSNFDDFLSIYSTQKEDTSISEAFDIYIKNTDKYLGHYFRNIYQILKYIHNSEIENKKFYSNIIRAQLSNEELRMLFYDSVSNIGSFKLLPLLIEYQFLEPLPFIDNINLKKDIQICIQRTKEINREYNINRLFGNSKPWADVCESVERSTYIFLSL